MIVMVENEEVTGQLNRTRIPDDNPGIASPPPSARGVAGARFTQDKLYDQYLQREGRPGTGGGGSQRTAAGSSHREQRDVDRQFRDF